MRGKLIALLLAAAAVAVAVYIFWPLALDEYVDEAEQIVVVRTDYGPVSYTHLAAVQGIARRQLEGPGPARVALAHAQMCIRDRSCCRCSR